MEKVSIVIPIYNAAPYLRQCLDSILAQEFKDFRLILINDGSTDESANICRKYADQDERIVLCHQRNQGVGQARNRGMELADSKYIIFMDTKGWIEPNLLQEVYDRAEEAQADWIIWSLRKIVYDKKHQLIKSEEIQTTELSTTNEKDCHEHFLEMTKWNNMLLDVSWNKLYRKEIIDKNKLKFPNIKRRQDIIFNLEYFKHVSRMVATPLIYSNYRITNKGYDYRATQEAYDIAYYAHVHYKRLLDEWGRNKEEEREYIDYYFLISVFEIMKGCMDSEWKWGFFKRYAYIKDLMRKIEVKEVAQYITKKDILKGVKDKRNRKKISYIRKGSTLRMVLAYYRENMRQSRTYRKKNKKEQIAKPAMD